MAEIMLTIIMITRKVPNILNLLILDEKFMHEIMSNIYNVYIGKITLNNFDIILITVIV